MSSPPTTGRLRGRVAIITGSSGGLGRAIAHLFASEGATCFCVDKYANPRNPVNAQTGKADDWNNRITSSPESASATLSSGDQQQPVEGTGQGQTAAGAREAALVPSTKTQPEPQNEHLIPTHLLLQQKFGQESATFHAADLTSEASVETMISSCLTHHPRIDILINAHGISTESTHPSPLRCHDLPLTDFLLTQSINTTSLFLTCKHVLSQFLSQTPLYPTRGWIVNVASIQGLVPFYACPGYATSKGAVVMMTKQIALDYAADGVVCNSVCPGFLDTSMTSNLKAMREEYEMVAGRQRLRTTGDRDEGWRGGFGRVEDVARMVLVLAGDDVRWMTGQPVVVDGGYTIS